MIAKRIKQAPVRKAVGSHWIGMDIGTAAIKLARTTKDRGDWTVHLQRLIPLSRDSKINSETLSDGIVGQLVEKEFPLESRQGSKQVACVLSSSVVELQTVELPQAEENEVRQMLSVEFAGRSDGKAREFDFFKNETSAASQEETSSWTVLSVPTSTALGIAESLWKQGLQCESLNTLPCVLSQAVSLADPSSIHKTVVALDWGVHSPSLTLISKGRPIYSRPLRNCGLDGFIQTGCDRFQCSESEFHALLLSLSQFNDSFENATKFEHIRNACLKLCHGVLGQLVLEVDRTLSYLQQEYPNQLPEELWVFGGGGIVPDVCPHITAGTKLDARLWQLPSRSNQSGSVDPLQAVFGTAIVLSILGASR